MGWESRLLTRSMLATPEAASWKATLMALMGLYISTTATKKEMKRSGASAPWAMLLPA